MTVHAECITDRTRPSGVRGGPAAALGVEHRPDFMRECRRRERLLEQTLAALEQSAAQDLVVGVAG